VLDGVSARRVARHVVAFGALTVAGMLGVAGCGGGSSSSSTTTGPPAPRGAQAKDAQLVRGRLIYKNYCAECHGTQGQGGVGPQLAGGAVVRAFPNIQDQITLVENGRGLMPAWNGKLSAEQIRDVVRYEREVL